MGHVVVVTSLHDIGTMLDSVHFVAFLFIALLSCPDSLHVFLMETLGIVFGNQLLIGLEIFRLALLDVFCPCAEDRRDASKHLQLCLQVLQIFRFQIEGILFNGNLLLDSKPVGDEFLYLFVDLLGSAFPKRVPVLYGDYELHALVDVREALVDAVEA